MRGPGDDAKSCCLCEVVTKRRLVYSTRPEFAPVGAALPPKRCIAQVSGCVGDVRLSLALVACLRAAASSAPKQVEHDGVLCVHAVLRLLEHERVLRLHDLVIQPQREWVDSQRPGRLIATSSELSHALWRGEPQRESMTPASM